MVFYYLYIKFLKLFKQLKNFRIYFMMKKLTKEKAIQKINNKFNLLKYWFKCCIDRKMYTKKEIKEIDSIIKLKKL